MKFSLYLFRRATLLFAGVLLGITALVWVTQALRRLDIVTTKGQTLLTFVWMSVLTLPMMMVYVAPFAVVAGVTILLTQMHGDREIVVFEASGAPPRRILVPLLFFATFVGLASTVVSSNLAPAALHELRDRTADIRADFLTTVVQPGEFVSLEDNFTFYVSERLGDGSLGGLFFYDNRDPALSIAYTALRGSVVDVNGHSVMIMENGVMERRNKTTNATSYADFERYGLDMSTLQPAASKEALIYDPTEISFMSLVNDLQTETDAKRYSLLLTELNTRATTIFYPVASALVLFCFLGAPQTARQNRSWTLTIAIALACMVRLVAYAINNIVLANVHLWPLMWAPAILAIVWCTAWLLLARGAPSGRRSGPLRAAGGAA